MSQKMRKLAFQCDCHGPHFMVISWWPGDPREGLEVDARLDLSGDFWTTWKFRLKYAWQYLTLRGEVPTSVGICLNAENLREITSAFTECADEWDAYLASLKAEKEKEAGV